MNFRIASATFLGAGVTTINQYWLKFEPSLGMGLVFLGLFICCEVAAAIRARGQTT